jgi:hypothetical protein
MVFDKVWTIGLISELMKASVLSIFHSITSIIELSRLFMEILKLADGHS